jgi:hypothetical protein
MRDQKIFIVFFMLITPMYIFKTWYLPPKELYLYTNKNVKMTLTENELRVIYNTSGVPSQLYNITTNTSSIIEHLKRMEDR